MRVHFSSSTPREHIFISAGSNTMASNNSPDPHAATACSPSSAAPASPASPDQELRAAFVGRVLVATLERILLHVKDEGLTIQEIALVPPLKATPALLHKIVRHHCHREHRTTHPDHDDQNDASASSPSNRTYRWEHDEHGKWYLGLPLWTVAFVVPVLAQRVLQVRDWIKKSRDDAQDLQQDAAEVASALCSTRLMLLYCPSHAMVLNLRKYLLEFLHRAASSPAAAGPVQAELELTRLLLTKEPSNGAVWYHRYWLSSVLAPPTTIADVESLLHREHAVIVATTVRKPRNYFAWAHRARVLHWLVSGLYRDHALATERKLVDEVVADPKHCNDQTVLQYRAHLVHLAGQSDASVVLNGNAF
ncbi:hypothetical protein AMAG_01730 [Allomyces macrogynus ATCC 38327]|uniref:Protein prenyltransferase alpha subunit repeat-containing protein 1 n=1 Tax=Allomyces macrogynus (strain ATCC 38327) TaxID=578462 RepID=A0A0L0S0D2_ALLM3|nr:hypothetical protein AMAG_01730 [Allomyces macrogynus ATCC 38327]|eukprot:KNE55860.1 hypothetical protein AMAG_01730 [Allomyces macrogynus ATCC 38327]